MAREVKVVIRLNEEMKVKFQSLADDLGMSMSALGAWVIGTHVKNQEKIATPMMEEVINAMKQAIKEGMEDTFADEEVIEMAMQEAKKHMIVRRDRP